MENDKMNVEPLLTIRNLKTSPADIIDQLTNVNENELYRAVLRIQNDLNIAENVRYLSGNRKWTAAKTVLDLGCGPGDLVAHLSGCFADKFYAGVDLNESFITMAKGQTKTSSNCVFYQADLYEFAQGRYDFVILRAVLQHLNDPDRFMKHLPALLNDSAAVLFLETTRENFVVADPPITTFNEFYCRLEAIQKEHTGSRDCIAELKGQLGKYDFKLLEMDNPMIPVTNAEDRVKAVQYLILGCAIAKKMMSMPIEFEDLFADLIHWHEVKDSRLSLKSRRMLIESV
jgi:2-polyprenyl-3-methyl-5-hydroxy-6-metoxy-1,4-benzoquinol methylase